MNSEIACEFCTFINERGAKICNACGRSLGLPSVNLNPSGIECTQCTFQNLFGSVNCGMCGTVLVKEEKLNFSIVTEQLCQICCCQMNDEFKMPRCTHIFCASCAKQYFTIKIMGCGINTFRCPIDVCVSFDELKNKAEFFNELKLVLVNILDENTKKVFVNKVGILDIMDKPGFLRCSMCNHGFISSSKTRMVPCPDCLQCFCSKCCKKWTSGHSQTNCSSIGDGNNDLQMYTNATCPQCKYNYFLERGGCMHITCSQCSYEYCEFCFKKMTGKGKSCDFPNCSKGQSLHGHHPRNCMYYVQEMDHPKLEELLKKNGVRRTTPQGSKTSTCKVKVNVSIGESWIDSECNEESTESYNNMCLKHYKWHLGELMKRHNIDPVEVMNNLECVCELKRNNVKLASNNANYFQPIEDGNTLALRSLIQTHIPHQQILQ